VIEAPFALCQVERAMLARNAVKTPEIALGLVPEVHDSIDVVLIFHKCLGAVEADVTALRDIQHIVTAEGIGVDSAIRVDLTLVDQKSVSDKAFGMSTAWASRPASGARTLGPCRERPACTCPFCPAEITLVHPDLTRQQFGRRGVKLLGNETSHLVEVPGRRVPDHARHGSH